MIKRKTHLKKSLKLPNLKYLLVLCLLTISPACLNNKDNLRIIRSETFFNNLKGEPENLHPIKSTDYYSSVIQSYILESLLERNKDNYEWESLLAKKWEISPDGKTFTFELYDNLKWSDGKALTAHDVKFSFEAYRNPKYGGIRYIPYFEKMESAKVLSDTKIQFRVKELYFGNFQVIASIRVLPKHIYQDPKMKMSKNIIGSGAYVLNKYFKGKILVLKKNPFWEERKQNSNKETFLFKTIVFRFVNTEADTLLRMEKEHLDFSFLTPESFFEKTDKKPWGDTIEKVKFKNKQPSGYSYIGFNFKKKLFQDKRVRKALAHLLNRDLINKKFLYNQVDKARGPWYFWSDYANPQVKAIEFNPGKARELLRQAGWKDEDRNGILEKTMDGQKKELAFSILYANADSEKYLTLYQEDLKKAGIKLSLKILDWTSFLRLIDDKTFSAVMMGWGAGAIDLDPKQIWHSDSSQNKGSNFISYSNPQVDALIDKGRAEMDKKKRVKTFQEVFRLIAEDVPYIFMFNSQNKFYGVHKRIDRPADTFNYSLGMDYWSLKSNH